MPGRGVASPDATAYGEVVAIEGRGGWVIHSLKLRCYKLRRDRSVPAKCQILKQEIVRRALDKLWCITSLPPWGSLRPVCIALILANLRARPCERLLIGCTPCQRSMSDRHKMRP